MAHVEQRAAVQQRLADGEVEARVVRLEGRAVERALASLERRAPALRALVRRLVRSLLVQEQLDARVGGRRQRLRPARRGAAVRAGLLAPTLERLVLVGGLGFLEQRLNELEQLARAAVRLRLGRADDDVLDLVRERVKELRARLLRADDDDLRGLQPADCPVELRGDVLQVLGDELLDVARVARLRPAALVVAARLVLGAVDDLLEPPGAKAEDLAALAADEGDDRAVVAADELRERREMETAAYVHLVRHGAGQRERAGRTSPDTKTASPRAPSLLNSLSKNSRIRAKSPLQPLPLGVRQLVVAGFDPLLGLREERVDARVDRGRESGCPPGRGRGRG